MGKFWLDPFSMAISKDGVVFPAEETIALGDGIQGEDDPANEATKISVVVRDRHKVTLVSLVSAGYAVLAADDLISITGISGASKTITLPAAPVVGHTITIKDPTHSVSGAHTLVIDANGNTIENSALATSTITLSDAGLSLTLCYVGGGSWVTLNYYHP